MAKKSEAKTPEEIDHARLITWVTESEDSTDDSRALSEKCRDYYDSIQLTAAEIAALNKRKQAPVVINRVKPKVDALLGLEKAAKTTAKAFPRTPKHEEAAEASTEAIRFVLQDNAFEQTRSSTWENMLIEGTGGGEVVVNKKSGKVTINHIMWDRIIYDPHSRRKDFSDARYLGQVVWMDYDEALEKYSEYADVLEDQQSGSQTYDDKPRWMDTTRRRVKIVELYYRKGGEVHYACFTRGGYVKPPQISPYVNEEGETEWPYEFGSLFVDREGGRYGSIRQLLDVQDEINKRRSKALHLMSVRQTFGTAGAVTDLNKARQELAKPDGHLETAFGEFGKDFGVLPTGDMQQAQFNLLAESKAEMDIVGANSAVQGKDKTVQSGIALQRRQQAGQTEIGPMFDVLRYWQYRVFKKVWNRIKQYWKEEKWIRVTDDENNLRWVGLNKPMTKGEQLLKQAQEGGAPPEMLQQLQARIAQDPMMQEVVSTENDIAQLDVDIILQEVPDVLTAQIEDFQVLGEMVKSGFPMPPIAVIEASPLSNKDKIIKLMKEQPQIPPEMQKQMEQQQEQMKALAQENQQLKSDTQSDMAKLQAKSQESQMQMQLKKEQAQAELQLQAETQAQELQLLREKTAAEIELKRAVAQADYDIEAKKLTLTHDTESKKLEFDQECRRKDEAADAQASVMPQSVDAITLMAQALQKISAVIENQTTIMDKSVQIQERTLKTEEEILKHQISPKRVSIGGVQRSDGRVTGATVATSLQ